MELRWILIGIAVVVIALVIAADVWRRQRNRKHLMQQPPPVALTAAERSLRDNLDFNPELPGKVRIVRKEPRIGDAGETQPMPILVQPSAPAEPVRAVEQVDMFGDVDIPASKPAPAREMVERGEVPRRETATGRHGAVGGAAKPEKKEPEKKPGPEEVIVVHVMGGTARLHGRPLLQSALDSGLRFGEYNIFHRYESAAQDARALFSMANAVEPGTFDLDAMETQTYVGVSFFLMLPGPANSRQALDTMIDAAKNVAKAVNGELHDQQHSVLTPQTIEHLRQRITEFERRRLAHQLANG